jgi:hypothetical protein
VLNKPNANWTCDEQRDAVFAMWQHKTDIFAIIKTGASKTMIPLTLFSEILAQPL